jgi:hypothetical protein
MIQSPQEFIALSDSEHPDNQHRARYEDAPEEVWFEIVEKYPDYIRAVIWNKTVPLNILRCIAKSPDAKIRCDVAMKRKLDDALFEMLSQDPDDSVRAQIVSNPKTPRHISERLALDREVWVAQQAREKLV